MNEIFIYDELGPSAFGLIDSKVVSQALQAFAGEDLTVRVNSPGGDATEGLAIGQALKRHDGRITLAIDALAASAATLFSPGADEIVMSPHAFFVTHDPFIVTVGGQAIHQQRVEALGKMRDTIIDIYKDRTGNKVSRSKLRDMLDADEVWLNAEEALEMGFVDRIAQDTAAIAANVGSLRGMPEEVTVVTDSDDIALQRQQDALTAVTTSRVRIKRRRMDLLTRSGKVG